MISDPGTPTLDQLRVFLAVVDVGSFAGAARKLHRATSVVSYSIANLELQLGVSLFDRKTTRKPQLTDAGRTVLAEARTIYSSIDGLRAKVRGLLHGLEAEVHLVLDVMLPRERMVDALKPSEKRFQPYPCCPCPECADSCVGQLRCRWRLRNAAARLPAR